MSQTSPNGIQEVVVGHTFLGKGIEIPGEHADKDFWKVALRYQFWYSMAGLTAGLACIIGGVLMILNGVTGLGEWSADFMGVKLNNATPGVAMFAIGVVLVHVTKLTVKIVRTPPVVPPPVTPPAKP